MSTQWQAAQTAAEEIQIEALRSQFPILAVPVHGRPLAYLDNAATTQKPAAVIEALVRYYQRENANIHRGVHYLSQVATDSYESARRTAARFIRARSPREIVFVRGTTEGVNLVAQSFARPRLKPGDEVVISAMEHHSNIVPWQLVCEQTGARLKVLPMNDRGELLVDRLPGLLNSRTRIAALVHVSNALGTVNPIREMIRICHAAGVPVLVDAAQAVPHLPVDVQELEADFLAFSGHKVYGPTGIGVLYGREELLEAMPPYQGGGDMISAVSFERTIYNEIPHKFEAGTPHVAGAIGLGAALEFVLHQGLERIEAYESRLLRYAEERLQALPEVQLIGRASARAAVVSFVVEGVHPHDLGTVLDQQGVAIRTGHHCAQPVMDFFGIPATARASFACYNTFDEVDRLVTGVRSALEVFR
ncbi:MAG: cysteine desulfurase [Acidobacteriota bacterium]